MSTVKYDKDTNTLQIGKGNNSEQKSVSPADIMQGEQSPGQAPNQAPVAASNEVRELKGFILTVTNDESDIQRIKSGMFPLVQDKVKLFPALAGSDDEAIEAARKSGYEVIHVAPYEFLKFQTELIENVATQANVKIIVNKDMFVAQSLEQIKQ